MANHTGDLAPARYIRPALVGLYAERRLDPRSLSVREGALVLVQLLEHVLEGELRRLAKVFGSERFLKERAVGLPGHVVDSYFWTAFIK